MCAGPASRGADYRSPKRAGEEQIRTEGERAERMEGEMALRVREPQEHTESAPAGSGQQRPNPEQSETTAGEELQSA